MEPPILFSSGYSLNPFLIPIPRSESKASGSLWICHSIDHQRLGLIRWRCRLNRVMRKITGHHKAAFQSIVLKEHADALPVMHPPDGLVPKPSQHTHPTASRESQDRREKATYLSENLSDLQNLQLRTPLHVFLLGHTIRHHDPIQCTGVYPLDRIAAEHAVGQ